MCGVFIDDRENYLDSDEKIIYKKRWETASKRFWKENLIKLFKSWNRELKTSKDFKRIFERSVVGKLLNKKNLLYIKSTTYKPLMSLFSKFGHFYKKYQESIKENIEANTFEWKEVQQKTQREIAESFDIKLSTNPREDDYMSIDDEWNILPPKTEENIQ